MSHENKNIEPTIKHPLDIMIDTMQQYKKAVPHYVAVMVFTALQEAGYEIVRSKTGSANDSKT